MENIDLTTINNYSDSKDLDDLTTNELYSSAKWEIWTVPDDVPVATKTIKVQESPERKKSKATEEPPTDHESSPWNIGDQSRNKSVYELDDLDDALNEIISSSSSESDITEGEDTECKQDENSVEPPKAEFTEIPLEELPKDKTQQAAAQLELLEEKPMPLNVETAPPVTDTETNAPDNLTDENDMMWTDDEK